MCNCLALMPLAWNSLFPPYTDTGWIPLHVDRLRSISNDSWSMSGLWTTSWLELVVWRGPHLTSLMVIWFETLRGERKLLLVNSLSTVRSVITYTRCLDVVEFVLILRYWTGGVRSVGRPQPCAFSNSMHAFGDISWFATGWRVLCVCVCVVHFGGLSLFLIKGRECRHLDTSKGK